ncbi:MAG: EFR1 family ferrodoxin [Ruminococcus sp.]|uniref:EFR1 family ferrodoxin n=1 Tax=Ruminococcus sp. TaxID=41978 RepID=UPI0025D64DDF|nr:EFR1 family ferrodoxin [Ruminococcus sp.]MCR5599272.1 EFR1 family ferrodoxin [Ruminococcus sp.]
MVLYFSATGNTEFLAKELSKRLGDSSLNLINRIKEQDFSPVASDKPFVICAPVYICEMPRFLSAYLKKLPLTGSDKVYFIMSSAGYSGISSYLAKKLAKRKGLRYMGCSEVVMPRNYFIGHYPMQSGEEIKQRLLNAYEQVGSIADNIAKGKMLRSRHVYMFEKAITLPFNPVWSKLKLKAKDFAATDKCVTCGRCVQVCPLNNISIKDGRPVWSDNCTHCMACIGNCPAEAINYGNAGASKAKYNFSKYKHFLNEKNTDIHTPDPKIYKRRKNG